jgi:hypothetical protein
MVWLSSKVSEAFQLQAVLTWSSAAAGSDMGGYYETAG